MSIKTVKDCNQLLKYKWIRPPTITITGCFIHVVGIIRKSKRLEVISEVFDGFIPIHYMNDRVLHWNHDWSKCFFGREEFTGVVE